MRSFFSSARWNPDMTEKYICIHGHFYQPPRENPWLEAIELQDSARPYHDWNERITAQCYAANGASRILDENNRIVEIVNNYASISFNFGPTLLAWLEDKAPDVYSSVLEGDRESQKRFSGHGSALAQAYNHMILPLANRRDKLTQVLWGIRDFEYRFGRMPEGMWLPETAVDLETLDVMAEHDIRFTILAPRQASRVRPCPDDEWEDVSGGKIDPTMAYTLQLPSGRSIVLFFYNGAISRAVAFERLLSGGELFAQRLLGGFSDSEARPQLVHIATDGETYGHHHHHGDMALAYALQYIESGETARLTNYGEYLDAHAPTHEVEIFENSSWSCIHGVERWRSDCGCNTGSHPEWNQAWRSPLREALDWLRDSLARGFEAEAGSLLKDPWNARNDYIQVVLDRSKENMDAFLDRHAVRDLSRDEESRVFKLLELQRHSMLMYTSCGWFFDELSGIETVQVIQYAGRAIQLSQEVFTEDVEAGFLDLLEKAPSNISEHQDGRCLYEKFVRPTMVDLHKVCAHYTVSSLFEEYTERTHIFCFQVDREDYQTSEIGRVKLVVGRAKLTSKITHEASLLDFGVLHFGDHNLNCGVREYQGEESYENLKHDLFKIFAEGDFPNTLRSMDTHFGPSTYSLKSLFRDERRRILDTILSSTIEEAGAAYRQIYESHAPLMRFLKDSGTPPPKELHAAADLVLNESVRHSVENDDFDVDTVKSLLKEAELTGVSLDADTLEYDLRKSLESTAEKLLTDPHNVELLDRLQMRLELVNSLDFEVRLWKVQNVYYYILQTVYPKLKGGDEGDSERTREWIARFAALGEKLSVRIDPAAP
jgi:alpha-amylase/alpha-mannosidase (GH57 family)